MSKEDNLLHLMAWQGMSRHERFRDELTVEMCDCGIVMLACLGALDLALVDLVRALEDAGLWRHSLKRQVNLVVREVACGSSITYRSFGLLGGKSDSDDYSKSYECIYALCDRCLSAEDAVLRAYNMCVSLARIFTLNYERVGLRLGHGYLQSVVNSLPKLYSLPFEDYAVDRLLMREIISLLLRSESSSSVSVG